MNRELKDESKFKSVRVSFDSIEWCNQADIDPRFLYEKSVAYALQELRGTCHLTY